MSEKNSMCSTLDHSSKPTVSLALGQVVRKLVFNEDLGIYAMPRHIVSISHGYDHVL